jgi:hypothetical protein
MYIGGLIRECVGAFGSVAIASEKSYGMISLFIEPDSIKKEIRADLIRMSDVVIKYGTVGYEVIKT